MLISVIIPTRHRNDLLSLCLERLSPGAQTLPAEQYEVIVTDDGAQTTAQQLIAQKFPWARWVAGPRRGPAANRNNGARHARGEFIAFTDDDCLPSGQWLSSLASAICDDIDVYEGKTTCGEGIKTPIDEAPLNLSGGHLWSCNLMARATTFTRVGGFDEDFPNAWCEDVEFFTRIQREHVRWQFVPEAVIDHPVRRRALGWTSGTKWGSRVLLWYKEGNQSPAWRWIPLHLLKIRTGQMMEYSFSRYSLVAFGSMLLEFVSVVAHLPQWESKYRPSLRRPVNKITGPRKYP
jgi:GT2 family glycosyltransferase